MAKCARCKGAKRICEDGELVECPDCDGTGEAEHLTPAEAATILRDREVILTHVVKDECARIIEELAGTPHSVRDAPK